MSFLEYLLNLIFSGKKQNLSDRLTAAHQNIEDLLDTAHDAAQDAVAAQEEVEAFQKKADDADNEAVNSSIIAMRMRNQLIVTEDDRAAHRKNLALGMK
jgi:hypothetical protein